MFATWGEEGGGGGGLGNETSICLLPRGRQVNLGMRLACDTRAKY